MDDVIQKAYAARRWLIVAVAAQLVLVIGLVQIEGLFEHVGMDYLTTYTAANMIVDGNASSLYDTRAQWEYQRPIIDAHAIDWGDRIMHPYISPPLLGILSIPLLVLGPSLAYVAWTLLNLMAVVIAVRLIVQRLGVDWQSPLLILAGALPLFMVLMLGQVEGLLFLAFVLSILELRAGRDVRAGLALAVLAIKPPLLLAPLLYLAVTGRRRAFWPAVASTGVQAAASMILVGPQGVREFIQLSQRLSSPDGSIVTNVWGMVNLRSVVVRSLPVDDQVATNASIVLLTLTTLAATAWFWRRSAIDPMSLPCLALLAVTTVLTSYHALYHTATLALLAVVLLVAHAYRERDHARAVRLTVFSWGIFSLLPTISFVLVQTSKVPAAIGVIGVLLLWGASAITVAQHVAVLESATQPRRSQLQPWYVVIHDAQSRTGR